MADEQKQIIRRAPAVPKKISDLKPEMGRVCLAGTIISKNKDIGSFILDDGENKILILTNDPKEFEQLREGTFIRVMGKVRGQYHMASGLDLIILLFGAAMGIALVVIAVRQGWVPIELITGVAKAAAQ